MSRIIILAIIGCLSITPTGWTLEFGYVSPIGPANWSTLNPDWAICGNGNRQSPINIPTQESAYWPQLNLIIINEDTVLNGTLMNNAHTVGYNIQGEEATRPHFVATYERPNNFQDGLYVLEQFHFHWAAEGSNRGSENQFDGRAAVAEVHLVSRNIQFNTSQAGAQPNGYLVLGIKVRVCENSDFYPVFGANNSYLDQIKADPDEVSVSLRLSDIYNCDGPCTDTNSYYTFQGSFTTPPCSEAVTWWVAEDMLCISQAQLDMLRSQNVTSSGPQLTENTRPIQELNQRIILTNTNAATTTLMNMSLSLFLLLLALLFV
ncbi:Carbonic anhydrase 2-like [Oopsacas minuta]|uniref:Carbonic anhydrase 2-like n=1 Tax=Oopsacas minuta TaxID=111878 RepID=A0AAV7JNV7_9METZ|nr:Carbonic anhydrase 2-like [Oopsacas minuta]